MTDISMSNRQLTNESGISTDTESIFLSDKQPMKFLLKDPLKMSTRLVPHEPGERRCLKCDKMFQSKSAANRICKPCSQTNASMKLSESSIARERGAKRLNGNLLDRNDSYRMNF